MEIKIHCKYDDLLDPKSLKNHKLNRNKHGKEQIERLAELYKYHGVRHPIIISNQSGCIVAGHGRKLAAIKAGLKKVPVIYQDFESEDQEYAFIQSDNAIALWAELDLEGIKSDLENLDFNFDMNMLGLQEDLFSSEEVKDEDGSDDLYTKKIKSPIYEPSEEKPDIKSLFDAEKTKSLLERIKKSEIPKEIKTFLNHAAARHTVFNYAKIADFYSHADKETQELMEESALVIIDFKKAIELGFVNLTEKIAEQYDEE